MTAPWQPYLEHQPVSSTGISLVEAFGKMVQAEWSLHSFELFEALGETEETGDGEIPVSVIVQICARSFQEAVLEGKLQTSARPLAGGEPIALKPLHWEIDNPIPRMASGCLNLNDWCDVLAAPTHRIFVNRKDFDAFLSSLMTQDEIYEAAGASAHPKKPTAETTSATTSPIANKLVREQQATRGATAASEGVPPASFRPAQQVEETILRRPEVLSRIGVSQSTLDNMVKAGTFPKQIQLSSRAVGWYASQIADWMENRAKSAKADS